METPLSMSLWCQTQWSPRPDPDLLQRTTYRTSGLEVSQTSSRAGTF